MYTNEDLPKLMAAAAVAGLTVAAVKKYRDKKKMEVLDKQGIKIHKHSRMPDIGQWEDISHNIIDSLSRSHLREKKK